jgi:hypothetical protein
LLQPKDHAANQVMAPAADQAAKARGREGLEAQVATRGRYQAQEMQPAVEQAVEQRAAAREAVEVLADLAQEPSASRTAQESAQGQAWAVDQWAPAQVAAQAVEHQVAKVLTLAQNQAAELSSEERQPAPPEPEGRAEAVPAA